MKIIRGAGKKSILRCIAMQTWTILEREKRRESPLTKLNLILITRFVHLVRWGGSESREVSGGK